MTNFPLNSRLRVFQGVEDIEEIISPFPLVNLYDYKIDGKINADGKGILVYFVAETSQYC